MGHAKQLLQQLCFDMGFSERDDYLPMYLSGELTEMLDFFPEMEYYRDIIFTFKFMMAPTGEAFPAVKPWVIPLSNDPKMNNINNMTTLRTLISLILLTESPEQPLQVQKAARLEWKYNHGNAQFTVKAFNKELVCVAPIPEKTEKKSIWGGILAFFFKQTRAPPSGADPSELAGDIYLSFNKNN